MTHRRRRVATLPDLDELRDIVAEVGRDLGLDPTPAGLNSDWSVEAWHLNRGEPNITPGDYYLLDTEDGRVSLVQRFYEDYPHPGGGEVQTIDSAPANEAGVRDLLSKAKRMVRSSRRRPLRQSSDELDRVSDMVKEVARDVGIKAEPAGLNADWAVEAWHLSPGRPNREPGDYYLLDNEDGGLELVQRFYYENLSPSGNTVEMIDSAPATERGARELLSKAKRMVKSSSRCASCGNRM